MPPPPRPPIICYDLQTNVNARRQPSARYRAPLNTGNAVRKTKVTVVQKDLNELDDISALWNQYDTESYPESRPGIGTGNNIPIQNRSVRFSERVRFNNKDVRLQRDLLSSEPYAFSSSNRPTFRSGVPPPPKSQIPSPSTLLKLQNINAKQAYGQKLRRQAEERELHRERKREQLNFLNKLEEMTTKLESVEKLRENILQTYGLSHNAAKYFQQLEDDNAKYRQKIDQFAETRSREVEQRAQQRKRYPQTQSGRIESRVVEENKRRTARDLLKYRSSHNNNNKICNTFSSTLNNSLNSSNNSPTTNTTGTINTACSSSTISISSCSSSPISTDEAIASLQSFVKSPPIIKNASKRQAAAIKPPVTFAATGSGGFLSSSTPQRSTRMNSSHHSQAAKPVVADKFSFYKGNPQETLEISDMSFFEKVEDKTMMEVNELHGKVQSAYQSVLNELDNQNQNKRQFHKL